MKEDCIVFAPTNNGVISVSFVDRELVYNHTWTYCKNSKSVINQTWLPELKISQRNVLSRIIMKAKRNEMVDHINGNPMDNCRSNLRLCSQAENNRNKTKAKRKCASIYKGVFWEKSCNRWRVQISVNDKNKHIGVFKLEEDAARAYDKAARQVYGEFACVNFPNESERGALN